MRWIFQQGLILLVVLSVCSLAKATAAHATPQGIPIDVVRFAQPKTDIVLCVNLAKLGAFFASTSGHGATKKAKRLLLEQWKELDVPLIQATDLQAVCTLRAGDSNEQLIVAELRTEPPVWVKKGLRRARKRLALAKSRGRYFLLYSKKRGLAERARKQAARQVDDTRLLSAIRPRLDEVSSDLFWVVGVMNAEHHQRLHDYSGAPGKQPGPEITGIAATVVQVAKLAPNALTVELAFHYNVPSQKYMRNLVRRVPFAKQRTQIGAKGLRLDMQLKSISFETARELLDVF